MKKLSAWQRTRTMEFWDEVVAKRETVYYRIERIGPMFHATIIEPSDIIRRNNDRYFGLCGLGTSAERAITKLECRAREAGFIGVLSCVK